MVINKFLSTVFGREIRLAYYTASCIGAKHYTKLGNGYCCAGVILIEHDQGMLPTGSTVGKRWTTAYCFQRDVSTILDENTDDFTPEQWVAVRTVIKTIEERLNQIDEFLKNVVQLTK